MLTVRPVRTVRAASVLGVGLLSLAGCLQLLSLEGDVVVVRDAATDADASGPACGLAITVPACSACMNANCCAQLEACEREPGCARYETCLLGCGSDYVCRSECLMGKPTAPFPEVPPLDACVVTSCETECGVSCGLVTSSIFPDAAVGCLDCVVATNNCAGSESCARSVDCDVVGQCLTACTTLDCKEACGIGHDAGAALLQAVLAPAQGACRAQCGYGVNWWCLGAVDVPVAQSSQTVMTLTVATAEGVVLPGLTVRACFPTDYDCTKPLDTELTDANGVATLTVRGNLPGGDGFDGYFDVEPPPPADGGAPVIVPLLYFVNYPLGRATISSSAVAVIPTDLALAKSLGGVTGDDAGSSGDFVVIAFDCSLELAPGVAFQAQTSTGLNLDSQVRYINGSTVAAGTATDGQGIGFVFGVPAGEDVAVTETPVAIGRPAGTKHAFARAGAVSQVSVVPQ